MYEHCPRCYFLRYRVGIKTSSSKALEFGSGVHAAIEHYHINGELPNNIDRNVRAAALTYTERFPSDYLDEVEIGGDFPLWFRNPDNEEEVLPKPFKFFIDGVKLHGIKHISEHKTSASPWPQDKVHTEKQASLYSYAFREMFGFKEAFIQYDIIVKPKFGTGYWMQTLKTTRDTSDYANFYWWAKDIMDKMEADKFPKNYRITWPCDVCKVCTD
jgi:hypothetical protein